MSPDQAAYGAIVMSVLSILITAWTWWKYYR